MAKKGEGGWRSLKKELLKEYVMKLSSIQQEIICHNLSIKQTNTLAQLDALSKKYT